MLDDVVLAGCHARPVAAPKLEYARQVGSAGKETTIVALMAIRKAEVVVCRSASSAGEFWK